MTINISLSAMIYLYHVPSIVFVLVSSTWALPVYSRLSDVVDTENGPIQGFRSQLQDNIGSVDVFLSVPFAKPPLGDLRFKHPEPSEPWEGVYNATTFSDQCMQPLPPDAGSIVFSEDCLYLNVYSPVTRTTHKPVMVFIHGGGFTTGRSISEGLFV